MRIRSILLLSAAIILGRKLEQWSLRPPTVASPTSTTNGSHARVTVR